MNSINNMTSMLLNLSDISNEPLQTQIVKQIRTKILNGEVNPGDSLPSIRKLSRDQKVSVITVQRAYELLERESLIHSRRGKGFFVSEIKNIDKKKISEERLLNGITPIIESAFAEGMEKTEILEILKKAVMNFGEN